MKDFVSFIDGKVFELILVATGFLVSKTLDSRKTNPIKRYIRKYHFQHFNGATLLLLYCAPILYLAIITALMIHFEVDSFDRWMIASGEILLFLIVSIVFFYNLWKLTTNMLASLFQKFNMRSEHFKISSATYLKKITSYLIIVSFNFAACYFIYTSGGFAYQYLHDNHLIHLKGVTLSFMLVAIIYASYFIIRYFNNATNVDYVVRVKTLAKDIELGKNHEVIESADAITIIQKTEDSSIENAVILYKTNIISIDVISEFSGPHSSIENIENQTSAS